MYSARCCVSRSNNKDIAVSSFSNRLLLLALLAISWDQRIGPMIIATAVIIVPAISSWQYYSGNQLWAGHYWCTNYYWYSIFLGPKNWSTDISVASYFLQQGYSCCQLFLASIVYSARCCHFLRHQILVPLFFMPAISSWQYILGTNVIGPLFLGHQFLGANILVTADYSCNRYLQISVAGYSCNSYSWNKRFLLQQIIS